MLVSILIPIYNVYPYLRECLDSCLNQTYKDLEIICVDDGSTDNSGIIADEYAERDSRFKVIHKTNGGLPSARKAGLAAATGDYVFHLDGDDSLPVETIECLVRVAVRDDCDIVIGDYYLINRCSERSYVDSRINRNISGTAYLKFILEEGLFNIWGKLIRRSLYTDNKIEAPEEISMGEDLVAMIQLAYYAELVSYCKKGCYEYYERSSSMSLASDKEIGSLTDRSIFAVRFITDFLSQRIEGNLKNLLTNYVNRFIYEYLRSRYPVSLRRRELQYLVKYVDSNNVGIHSYRSFVVRIARYNLQCAKLFARFRNLKG